MSVYNSIQQAEKLRQAVQLIEEVRSSIQPIQQAAAPPGPVLSSGALTVEEISSPAFSDGSFDGGQLGYSSDGEGEWVKCLAFGGTGVMGAGKTRADLLTQSIGEGMNLYDDWVIDGGNKRLVIYKMFWPLSPPYQLGQFSAVQNAAAWLQANYPGSGNLNKVILLMSSQRGNISRWAFSYNYAWASANILGAYHGAAELPTNNIGWPDMSLNPALAVFGQNDATVSYPGNLDRANQINAASPGTPIDFIGLPGVGHTEYTWGDPFEDNRNNARAGNDYPGVITYINELVSGL